ncbi:pfs domain-containing protein, partial [Aureobasidium melanogenum]
MSVAQASTPSTHEKYSSEDYTIGIICALPIELAAAVKMLDKEHPRLVQDPGDDNSYRFGQIGYHNVVIGCLAAGRTGLVSAASVALKMKSSFRCVRFGLMVGIGGGVPSEEYDIRLGDIVISKPAGQHGGVVQYDLGKTRPNGTFERTGSLSPPPEALLTTITDVIAAQEMDELNIAAHLSQIAQRLPAYGFPAKLTDDLYLPNHLHKGGRTCLDLTVAKKTWYSVKRDLTKSLLFITARSLLALGGVLCFEMEAAGLMNNFPCLVIRGISDYSDSHKNDGWQRYAAATAAAFAKELLNHLAPTNVAQTQTISQAMGDLSLQLARNTSVTQQTDENIDRIMEREILDWLSPSSNFSKIQNEIRPCRIKDTGDWLIQDLEGLDWYRAGGLVWIHGVVKEFLILQEGCEEGLHWYRFTARLANRCVTAQAIETIFGDPPAESRNLIKYASQFWPAHARRNDVMPGSTSSDELQSKINSLLENDNLKNLLNWSWTQYPGEGPRSQGTYVSLQPLYFASLLGLKRSVTQLWHSCSQLTERKGFYGNAFNAAACMDHAEIVMWLTDHIDNPPDYFDFSQIVRHLRFNVAQTLHALLHKGPKTAIGTEIVYSMHMNPVGQEILSICLEEDLVTISITEELVKAAAYNKWNRRILEVLVENRVHEFPVNLRVLLIVAGTSESALRMLIHSRGGIVQFESSDYLALAREESAYATERLLNLGVHIPVTTELINILASSSSGSRILRLLLDTQPVQDPLPKSVVLTVARGFSLGTFEALLRHDWEDNNLIEELIFAIAFNCYLEPPAVAKITASELLCNSTELRAYRPTLKRSSEKDKSRALMSLINRKNLAIDLDKRIVTLVADKFARDVVLHLLNKPVGGLVCGSDASARSRYRVPYVLQRYTPNVGVFTGVLRAFDQRYKFMSTPLSMYKRQVRSKEAIGSRIDSIMAAENLGLTYLPEALMGLEFSTSEYEQDGVVYVQREWGVSGKHRSEDELSSGYRFHREGIPGEAPEALDLIREAHRRSSCAERLVPSSEDDLTYQNSPRRTAVLQFRLPTTPQRQE